MVLVGEIGRERERDVPQWYIFVFFIRMDSLNGLSSFQFISRFSLVPFLKPSTYFCFALRLLRLCFCYMYTRTSDACASDIQSYSYVLFHILYLSTKLVYVTVYYTGTSKATIVKHSKIQSKTVRF